MPEIDSPQESPPPTERGTRLDRLTTGASIANQVQRIENEHGDDSAFHQRVAYHLDVQRTLNQQVLTGQITQDEADYRTAVLTAELDIERVNDRLTGLLNRNGIDARLTEEVARSVRSGEPLQICLIDLDRFKDINDSYGHIVGDAVLQQTAGHLKSSIRSTDSAGRWGGEELILILPGMPPNKALEKVEKIRETLPDVVAEGVGGMNLPNPLTRAVTASFGLAQIKNGDIEGALAAADRALYLVKESGRNKVADTNGIYNPPPSTSAE